MIGKILLDKFGVTELLGGNINYKKIDIIPTIQDENDFDRFVARLKALEKDPSQVDLYLKAHGLDQVEGLKNYILNDDIQQERVNELIQAQNNQNNNQNIANIANQAHGFAGVNTAIQEYNKLTDTASKTKLAEAISQTNSSLGDYLSKLNVADAGMGGYIKSLVSAKAATIGLQAVTTIMNTAISLGISALVTTGISLISYLITKEDELAKKAQELGNKFNNTTSDIDVYKSKIEELKQVISDSSSSYEEVTNARRDLLEIQEELIEKYGSEAEGINAITEAINGETEALDNLKKTEWYNTKQDYNATDWKDDALSGIKIIVGQLTGKTLLDTLTTGKLPTLYEDTNLTKTLDAWNHQEINLPKSGNKNVDNLMDHLLTKGSSDWFTGDFTKGYDGYGSVTELKDKLGQIKSYANSQEGVNQNFINGLQSALNSLQEQYEQNYQIVSNSVLYDKIKSDDPTNTYDEELNKLEIIKSEYDDALLSNDEEKINRYAQEYADVLNAAMALALANGDTDVKEYFYNMFPTMKDVVNKINLKNELSSDSSLQNDSQSLNEFDKDDILNFLTSKEQEKGEKAFKDIRDKAIEDDVIDDSIEGTEKLIDLLVEWGVLKDKATEATNNNSTESATTTKTFKQAWNDFGTTGDEETQKAQQEAKEKLLELAKTGELSDTTLESTKEYKTLLEETGKSARETRSEISQLISTQEKVAGFQSQMGSIATLYNEFKDKDFVTAQTIESLPDVFKEMNGGKDFDSFSKIVGDPKSGKKKIQDAFNDIVTSYIKDQDILLGVTKDTQNAVIATLENAGITNAENLVTSYVNSMNLIEDAEKKYEGMNVKQLDQELTNFQNALKNKDISFAEACEKLSGKNAELMKTLGEEYKDDFQNWIKLLKKKKEAFNTWVTARDEASNNSIYDNSKNDPSVSPYVSVTTEKEALQNYKKSKKDAKKAKKKIENAEYKKITLDFDGLSYNPNASEKDPKDKNNKTKETKQSFDWLERRISVLNNRLDLLKAKIENVFSVGAKNRFINQEIKNTNKLINTYKKQAKVYKQQANRSAKSDKTKSGEEKSRLSKGLKKKIQNGQIKGSRAKLIKAYDSKKANAIQEYQDYWDKYQEALTNVQSAKTSKRELKIQKRQNWVDYYDSISDKYDAQIASASMAGTKNKLEKDRLEYIKESYKEQIKIARLEKDSVKAATLLAKKWKEIAETRERILQNQLDENADKRDYNNAAYENADKAGKQKIRQDNIASYKSDDSAHDNNVNSAKAEAKDAKSEVTKAGKAVTGRMKKDGLNKSTTKEIQSYINKGQKIPDGILEGTRVMLPELYTEKQS